MGLFDWRSEVIACVTRRTNASAAIAHKGTRSIVSEGTKDPRHLISRCGELLEAMIARHWPTEANLSQLFAAWKAFSIESQLALRIGDLEKRVEWHSSMRRRAIDRLVSSGHSHGRNVE